MVHWCVHAWTIELNSVLKTEILEMVNADRLHSTMIKRRKILKYEERPKHCRLISLSRKVCDGGAQNISDTDN